MVCVCVGGGVGDTVNLFAMWIVPLVPVCLVLFVCSSHQPTAHQLPHVTQCSFLARCKEPTAEEVAVRRQGKKLRWMMFVYSRQATAGLSTGGSTYRKRNGAAAAATAAAAASLCLTRGWGQGVPAWWPEGCDHDCLLLLLTGALFLLLMLLITQLLLPLPCLCCSRAFTNNSRSG